MQSSSFNGLYLERQISCNLAVLCILFALILAIQAKENFVSDLISNMDVTREIDKLQKERAVGPPKHKKQVRHSNSAHSKYWKHVNIVFNFKMNKHNLKVFAYCHIYRYNSVITADRYLQGDQAYPGRLPVLPSIPATSEQGWHHTVADTSKRRQLYYSRRMCRPGHTVLTHGSVVLLWCHSFGGGQWGRLLNYI